MKRIVCSLCTIACVALFSGCDLLDSGSGRGPAPAGAVDLGLSVKWATCNLGASSPEEYGDYYAWGETKPKTMYEWSNYKFNMGDGEYGPFSKYVTSGSYHPNDESYGKLDQKSKLEPADDAARAKLGKKWRIPTNEEWEELWLFCEIEWTTINGENGIKVTGDTGKWIFLPTAGFHDEEGVFSTGAGFYWSSCIVDKTSPYLAREFYFNSAGVIPSEDDWRWLGLSIRPVYD